MVSHKIIWSRRLGTARDSALRLAIPMGTPNNGGAALTRSGLAFIGATQERAIRAFDVRTGKLLWYKRLAAGAHAAPMTYRSNRSGRQFVVIAAGGSALLQSGYSDQLVAFALPGAQ